MDPAHIFAAIVCFCMLPFAILFGEKKRSKPRYDHKPTKLFKDL